MNVINNSFQALLVQLGPKECLLPQHDSTADAAKVQEVIQRSNILISERKKGKFSNITRVTYIRYQCWVKFFTKCLQQK